MRNQTKNRDKKTMKIRCAGKTDTGKRRSNNEDNLYLNGWYKTSKDDKEAEKSEAIYTEASLYAVCDGMGGEAFGEEAALEAVQTLDAFRSNFGEKTEDFVQEANRRICKKIEENGGVRIGTTFAALYINEKTAYSSNIGDSRIYQLRDQKLRQLSIDHTQAQRLVNQGILSREEMRTHPGKHRLTQHLGIFPEEMIVQAYHAEPIALKKDDRFLLCSDGLTDMLDDVQIEKILCEAKTPTEAAERLTQLALQAGGRDNITVVVLFVDEV